MIYCFLESLLKISSCTERLIKIIKDENAIVTADDYLATFKVLESDLFSHVLLSNMKYIFAHNKNKRT